MNFVLVTDAWEPQVNGVVRTWQHVIAEFKKQGHRVFVIHPGLFKSIPAPRYAEIRLAILPGRKVAKLLRNLNPDAIHISTEGTLGQAARRWCMRNKVAFTTSYHTQYPLYFKKYFGIPTSWTERFIRWFHAPAEYCFVPTRSVHKQLEAVGLDNTVVWSRGVDGNIFHPRHDYVPEDLRDLPRPIFLYAGRVAIEKNLEAFLSLSIEGTKVVVGDGPALQSLSESYPDTKFVGYRFGEELGAYYAAADAFVFPSHTDTFGVVMIEANACGLPVAAYPVTGPLDIIQEGENGCLDEDLAAACARALTLDRQRCAELGKANTWENCANTILERLEPISPVETASPVLDEMSSIPSVSAP